MNKEENRNQPSSPKTLEDYFQEINLFYRNVTSRANNETSTTPETQTQSPNVVIDKNMPPPVKAVTPNQVLTPEIEYQRFMAANPQKGAIRVQATVGKNAYPATDVNVVISKEFSSGKYDIYNTKTNISGITDTLVLPATPRSETEKSSGNVNLITYDIELSHPKFVTMIFKNVPIFEDVISIQKAGMFLKAVSASPNTPIVYDENDKNE